MEDRHNTLRRKNVKKVRSYIDFMNEILELKREGHALVLNGRDLYVDGVLSVTWARCFAIKTNGDDPKIPYNVRLQKDCLEKLKAFSEHIGCTVSELIEVLVYDADVRGGVPSIAEACNIMSYDSTRKLIEEEAQEVMRMNELKKKD